MNNDNSPLRLDYIGKEIYELNNDKYKPFIKSGSVYVFPARDNKEGFTKDGMIYNYFSNKEEPVRVRSFNDYLAIEPSGIVIPKEHVTKLNWSDETFYSISPRNADETREVFLDTFFAKYCVSLRCGKDFKKEVLDNQKSQIYNYISEEPKTYISVYDYMCLFCYYLYEKDIYTINYNVLEELLYGMVTSSKYKDLLMFDRLDILNQIYVLLFTGIVYPNYEKLGVKKEDLFIDWFDMNVNRIFLDHCCDSINDLHSEVIIDDSDIVINYLKEKHKYFKAYYRDVKVLGDLYRKLYYNYNEQVSKIKKLHID